MDITEQENRKSDRLLLWILDNMELQYLTKGK